jgi:N-acetylglucosaminyldiphosphoundecaprenol N-acetyl-beta-D-mannosaminyltransferase
VSILGVRVDDVTLDEAVERIASFLLEPRCHQIATINPEFIVAARRDPEFSRVLGDSDLNVPDGANLVRAARFLRQPLRERVGGRDLILKLAEKGASHGWAFFLLGGRENAGVRAAQNLQIRFPNLKIVGSFEGSPAKQFDNDLVSRVNKSGADILLVAYGAPKQDLWIGRNKMDLSSRAAIGVGGAFDSIAGKVPIAPMWMQRAGLEWLFRLYTEPWRWRRQLALAEFVRLTLLERLRWG